MPNIRYTKNRKTDTIDLRYSKQGLCLTINLKDKGKGDLIMDGCYDNSISTIWNGPVSNTGVEVSHNHIKDTLIVFDYELFILTNHFPSKQDLDTTESF